MPYREPAPQIDEVLEKRMIRALKIAIKAYEKAHGRDATADCARISVATMATKIFDKLPNDEQ